MAHEAEISFFKHLLPVGSQLNLTPTGVKPAVTQEPTTTSNKRARMEQTSGPKVDAGVTSTVQAGTPQRRKISIAIEIFNNWWRRRPSSP